MRRTVIPLIDLLAGLKMNVNMKMLHIDASVAIAALKPGYHGILKYLDRSQGVQLACTNEMIDELDIKVIKTPSAENASDALTKSLSGSEVHVKAQMIGIQ